MKVKFTDETSRGLCQGRKKKIEALVWLRIGNAAVVEVSYDSDNKCLKLEASAQTIFTNSDLKFISKV